MEELHRLHKDVPFGWFAWLQDVLARRATTAPERNPVRLNRTSLRTL